MIDEVVKPSAVLNLPPTSRRMRLTVVPKYENGTPESLISRPMEGLPGRYTVKYALGIPGRESFFGDANYSELVNLGESNIAVPDANQIRLWDTNKPTVEKAHFLLGEDKKITTAILLLEAHSFEDAERTAHNFLMPFLSWLSYQADVAVDVKACEIFENDRGSRRWVVNVVGDYKRLSWRPTGDLNLSQMHPNLRKLQSAYREAMNATNPFYKFLCFWKVIDACLAYKKRRERRSKRAGIAIHSQIESMPTDLNDSGIHPDDLEFFYPYLGKDFSEIRKSMKTILRDAIAHFTPGALVLDPDDFDDVAACEKAIPIVRYMASTHLSNEGLEIS
jgi:hypothetical protein